MYCTSLHHDLCISVHADTAACELKSGAIYPATFPDKGPDEDIRAAGLMVRETVCNVLFIYVNYILDNFGTFWHFFRHVNKSSLCVQMMSLEQRQAKWLQLLD